MAYRFKRTETGPDGLRRIVREQIDRALAELDGADGNAALSRAEVVHQVRKRCKKIRGAVRICRPAFEDTYRHTNALFRDAARLLSGMRDADAMLEAFDALMQRDQDEIDPHHFAEVRVLLDTARPDSGGDGPDVETHIAEFRRRILEARSQLDTWSIDGEGFDAVAGGLARTYSRGRVAMKTARHNPTTESLHEWRKRVKYHWYHCRLLQDIWADHMTQRCSAMSELSDMLGDDHDLAVLRQTIIERGGAVADHDGLDAFIELLDTRRMELQRDAFALGRRAYAEKPKQLRQRFKRYWKVWQTPRDREPSAVNPPGTPTADPAAPAG